MPKLDFVPYDGRIPTGDKLKRVVENLLNDRKQPADAVIALTDVYTGTTPPEFPTAEDAKKKMREWVGAEKRFYPHAALHDFEAWLLPVLGQNPSGRREAARCPGTVLKRSKQATNRLAYHLLEVFRTGSKTESYVKPRDAGRILKDEDFRWQSTLVQS